VRKEGVHQRRKFQKVSKSGQEERKANLRPNLIMPLYLGSDKRISSTKNLFRNVCTVHERHMSCRV
jgi:hypothetical protein